MLMKRNPLFSRNDEDGFVLVTALLFLLILTLVGVFATSTTILELKISGSDRVNKLGFYRADGGVQAAIALIEENISCATGFSSSRDSIGGIDIYDNNFAYVSAMGEVATSNEDVTVFLDALPSDDIRALRIADDASNRSDSAPRINLTTWGVTSLISGSAVQMAAGYEGTGKSAADGGSAITYQVHSQYKDNQDTETKIAAQWYHIVGQEGTCNY